MATLSPFFFIMDMVCIVLSEKIRFLSIVK